MAFGIQPLFDQSNTELVWYSDPHRNKVCLFICSGEIPSVYVVICLAKEIE